MECSIQVSDGQSDFRPLIIRTRTINRSIEQKSRGIWGQFIYFIYLFFCERHYTKKISQGDSGIPPILFSRLISSLLVLNHKDEIRNIHNPIFIGIICDPYRPAQQIIYQLLSRPNRRRCRCWRRTQCGTWCGCWC